MADNTNDLPMTGLDEPMSNNAYLMASLEDVEFAVEEAVDDAVLDALEAAEAPANVAIYSDSSESESDSDSHSASDDYDSAGDDYKDSEPHGDIRDYTIDIDPEAQEQLFTEARTTYNWLKTPVNNELIELAWDLAKFGPTAMNCSPLRMRVLKSESSQEKLSAAMAAGNKGKIGTAPVVLILAASEHFHTQMAKLFPNMPGLGDMLKDDPEWRKQMAEDNAWLQAGYLLLALRAVGLSVGPMNGADFEKIQDDFFANTGFRPFMVVNVGFAADPATDYPRNPRLTFREVAEIL
ncbi:MAG: malonic semialdehyde reductase [Cellulomonadaceae bacterium]|jgi:3-hydroxypropanoate dehydrogenase|nr:malonic semialdehyde reductase [Cellulomonadaceae bacterium]